MSELPEPYIRGRQGWELPLENAQLSMLSCGFSHRLQLIQDGRTTEIRIDCPYRLELPDRVIEVTLEQPSDVAPLPNLVFRKLTRADANDNGSLVVAFDDTRLVVPPNFEWDSTWTYFDFPNDIAIESSRGELAVGSC